VHPPEERAEMLAAIGVDSMDGLLVDIPKTLRIPRLELPDGLSEFETMAQVASLAAKNTVFLDRLTFRGGGVYRRFIPAAVAAVTGETRVLYRLHALPAGGKPGDPTGDLRVPDAHRRADCAGRCQRLALRRGDGRGRGGDDGGGSHRTQGGPRLRLRPSRVR